jgi:putative transposase
MYPIARIVRIVAPGILHHITQERNHGQKFFFNDGDYQAYIDLISEKDSFRITG